MPLRISKNSSDLYCIRVRPQVLYCLMKGALLPGANVESLSNGVGLIEQQRGVDDGHIAHIYGL